MVQVDWRQKLDTQRGAVLANELKNNACKLAKWTVQSILAGADNLKFGYVTRYNVKDSSRHVILGTQKFNPVEFGQQINLNMDNAWGVVRCILDLIMAQKVKHSVLLGFSFNLNIYLGRKIFDREGPQQADIEALRHSRHHLRE